MVAQLGRLVGDYDLDVANSRIGFAARYAMVSTVRGYFAKFSGRVTLAGDDLTASTAQIRVATASLTTGQAQRDAHLRSPDLLDVETWPELSFASTGVTAVDSDGRFRLAGELTVCGTTRPLDVELGLTAEATDHRGLNLVGFQGEGRLSRADFGLRWNALLETGGVLVGDEVDLSFDIALIRRAETSRHNGLRRTNAPRLGIPPHHRVAR
jgi:polyisoprenoid-binding protein YceI